MGVQLMTQGGKALTRQSLSKYINKSRYSRNMSESNSPTSNQLTNEVQINVNMSSASMKHWIGSHVQNGLIVTQQKRRRIQ